MKKYNNITRYSFLLFMALLVGSSNAIAGSNVEVQVTEKNQSGPSLTASGLKPGNKVQNSFLNKLVVGSDLIFRGKLIEISEGLSIEEIPYTFVTYDVKEVIAGKYSNDTITLKFVGGEFPNGNRLTATNTPEVKLGENVILMVQQSQNTGCDFVECEHGRFVLEDGKVIAANESAIVVDDKGGIDYISFAARISGKHKLSLAKSNIPRFISHLKSLDKKSLHQRKSSKVSVTSADKYLPFKAYPALTRAKSAPQVPKKSVKKKIPQQEGTAHDQWEVEQLRQNGGNPILSKSYPKDQN
ncbi:hypothetical protein [Aliikangiella coralliicola]|uniref:Uncharacterized protein n=1 Tax=Aliikangiella coralliicola TaxID=2592383 RepID=A0A545UIY1_9GAMM|nr:hypothetical protein [Aliikangiella coralliicola]TQV89434.1 hypothetical protein FLL46_00700 [Aliikangiella coralliicola]